jgi:MFS family permease
MSRPDETVTDPGDWTAPGEPPYSGVPFLLRYGLAQLMLQTSLYAQGVVAIPLKVAALAPGHKAEAMGLVAAVGGAVAIPANPFFGRLSDRCASRWGMRRPFLFLGGFAILLALVILADADSVAMVVVGSGLFHLAFNIVFSPLIALLADQVQQGRRARVSSLLAVGLVFAGPLASLTGVWLNGHLALTFILPGVVLVLAVSLLAVPLRDRRLETPKRQTYALRTFLSSFWVNPVRYPDFGWAWLTRLLINLAPPCLITFQVNFLIDLGISRADVPSHLLKVSVVYASTAATTSLLFGWISDRIGQRKPLVSLAGVVIAAGLAVVSATGTYGGLLAGWAVIGLGQGVYLAVDLALTVDVLPNPQGSAARDLGVINFANALPFLVVPAVGPLVLATGEANPNYSALFLIGAACSLLGSVTVHRVKGAR